MRAVIIGAGNAGRLLTERLCEENHDVIVVDHRAKALQDLESQFDVMTIHGHGANPGLLKSANLKKADMLVALTSHDEVNITACFQAKNAGVNYKVARIQNREYMEDSEFFAHKQAGIDLAVNPQEACAKDIYNILQLPGADDVIDLLGGSILAAGIKLAQKSPLLMTTLDKFPRPDLLNMLRIMAIKRNHDLLIPHGDTQIKPGDKLYLVGRIQDIKSFTNWALPQNPPVEKVVIAGGGQLDVYLASRLEKKRLQVVLLESDPQRAERCAEQLGSTEVLNINPLSREGLQQVELSSRSAFVASMEDDEDNIISGLLAGKYGARLTVAQAAQPEYVPILNSLPLVDRAVSTHLSTINAILHFVRGRNVKAVSTMRKLPGGLLEVNLDDTSKWTGYHISELDFPDGVLIASLTRKGKFLPPTGDVTLAAGDRLILFATPGNERRMQKLCSRQ